MVFKKFNKLPMVDQVEVLKKALRERGQDTDKMRFESSAPYEHNPVSVIHYLLLFPVSDGSVRLSAHKAQNASPYDAWRQGCDEKASGRA